ncbi:efflux RND transporter periplasmic adaptor subunit [bacterium]|nr:efflux RND transporter periplasmic adaptor subunit [bacterium]
MTRQPHSLLVIGLTLLLCAVLLPAPGRAQHQSMPGMQMDDGTATTPAAGGGDHATAVPAQDSSMPGMDMGGGGGAKRGIPPVSLVAFILFLVLLVLFVLARISHWRRPAAGVLGGLALLALVYAVTDYLVVTHRRPGQSTVWQATAMDMSSIKPVAGAVPVATEQATRGPFTAKVTYTGTVVALNDEDIYPRVTGRVVAVPVYDGDEVRPGQLVARLDDDELSGREREAAAGREAARLNARAAQEGVSAAEAMRRQREQMQAAAETRITEAKRMAAAAKAKQVEAEKAVAEARHAAAAAAQEQSMAAARIAAAQAETEAARTGLDSAGAELDAAQADLAYWRAEIKRMKTLLDGGAASVDEYQMEEAKYKSAAAAVQQKQAMVAERKSMLNRALAMTREAQATAGRAAAQVSAADANADRMAAGVNTAQAEYEAATARVEMARADARAAAAEVAGSAAGVRVAGAQARAMRAMTSQTAAALYVARTVRGYTEIRATSRARVLQRVVSPGTLVTPGTLLLRLAQVDRVRLQANVSQADLAVVRVGSRVWARPVDAPDRRIVASITSISPSADPASRTSVVEALVPNPHRWFLPGGAVVMELETATSDSAVTVPNSAVVIPPGELTDSLRRAVWTVQSGGAAGQTTYTCVMHPQIHETKPGACPICKMPLVPEKTGGGKLAHLVDVQVGPSDGRRTQIISGVAAGQEIIYRGLENLREGQKVQDVPWGEAGPVELPKPAAGGSMPAMPGMDHGGGGGAGHAGHGM